MACLSVRAGVALAGGRTNVAQRSVAAFSRHAGSTVQVRRLLTRVSALKPIEQGPTNTTEYRVFFERDGDKASPWHCIPLHAGDGAFTFVSEIPKETSAKFEVATKERRNPIKQDIKKGKLRHYPMNINWNYGLFPQTWEDPKHKHPGIDAQGDNDPVDVVEIGAAPTEVGGIYEVKVLGAYALLDEGELDWKVITIRTDDPKAAEVNSVEDVERVFPGELDRIFVWFRDYKIPDGKGQNQFAFEGKIQSRELALRVIEDTHQSWINLQNGKRGDTEGLALF
ncbi:inorganic pyrophosphatase [Helicosporidium sp. ATCC 50920]|nr:inorganic pyrophosphatase [Helicosporidium sp. ATCC 50920]|eukprot:KDD76581.1 inorganic pyrophosphatase [Helicosporidium sp. ATCC 50920]